MEHIQGSKHPKTSTGINHNLQYNATTEEINATKKNYTSKKDTIKATNRYLKGQIVLLYMVKENPFSMRKSQEHLQYQCVFASKITEVDMQKTEKKKQVYKCY